ncbi:MAG: radical SAM protein [Gemmatimonadales bacterium]|nr:radical SAM protein [Gemmatimonadales bacterium]
MSALGRIRQLAAIVREPVLGETRGNLKRSWARLPEQFKVPQQMLGRGGNGCGATIGVMPRCDFACTGCYLGEEANRIPPAPLEEVKAQMRALRPTLGNAGNLQLTDGEVTLRPEAELLELLRYARELRLIPMLMTHGDTFRRRPGLLERLIVQGGLVELSIHIDTTQRGRVGRRYRMASTEEELTPLRDEFAELLRRARRETGRQIRAATTMTVTAANLDGVPAVVRWLLRNADAFRLISFQPIAQVGRTAGGLGGGVSVESLWARIAEGLEGPGADPKAIERGQLWVGHPGCNRYVPGVVVTSKAEAPRFHPLRTSGDAVDERIVDGFLQRFGGISFRMDPPLERWARWLGLAAAEPRFVFGSLGPFALHWLRRIGHGRVGRALRDLVAGRVKTQGLVLVSHHFMSRVELESPLGRERSALCVFHVPVEGRLVPMCEVNATEVRDRYYERLGAHGAGSGGTGLGWR